MSMDQFDELTRANMQVALERACALLPSAMSELHAARSNLAQCLIDAAQQGRRTLAELTEAGRQAVDELNSSQ